MCVNKGTFHKFLSNMLENEYRSDVYLNKIVIGLSCNLLY